MKILLTGANGFVGQALIPKLLQEGHTITALVRSKLKIGNFPDGVEWIEGDLLNPDSLPELSGIDAAYYLVHGLNEESSAFEYFESLAAVNFVNWIRPEAPSVIYLGALGPRHQLLSSHLRSRHLTGAILGASGLGVTEFRASIVLGAGSLSFEMIKALSERFPFRPEMPLLSQACQPISLQDLLDYLAMALNHPHNEHRIYEIGGADVVTYGEMMDAYAEVAMLKRKKLKLPVVETKVLLKMLDYALPEYANAGKKLMQSLEYPTVVNHTEALTSFPEIKPDKIEVAMAQAEKDSTTSYTALWDKDFLKSLLSDKILTQSGLLSPDLIRNLEKMGKLKDILLNK